MITRKQMQMTFKHMKRYATLFIKKRKEKIYRHIISYLSGGPKKKQYLTTTSVRRILGIQAPTHC